ncbi:unnamed protein product [Ceratitis capitata]|uniref:(Mediterranean fruit fly) hypothetical protein n=1 Tax=Ceratitis capitata TaxID=7213 RepID=A0A811UJK6_CERCA|nr:unnamed protein product [Ceratitis capitata]
MDAIFTNLLSSQHLRHINTYINIKYIYLRMYMLTISVLQPQKFAITIVCRTLETLMALTNIKIYMTIYTQLNTYIYVHIQPRMYMFVPPSSCCFTALMDFSIKKSLHIRFFIFLCFCLSFSFQCFCVLFFFDFTFFCHVFHVSMSTSMSSSSSSSYAWEIYTKLPAQRTMIHKQNNGFLDLLFVCLSVGRSVGRFVCLLLCWRTDEQRFKITHCSN